VYLHGAQKWDDTAARFAADLGEEPHQWPRSWSCPGVVAVVDLVDVCAAGPAGELCDCGPWALPGQYHWRLAGVRAFTRSVPCAGRQGLWWPKGALAEQLAAAAVDAVDVDREGRPL
jgi:hypothetical protein